MKVFIFTIFLFCINFTLYSKTLIVGNSELYQNIQEAFVSAESGDTIFVRSGVYSGGMFVNNYSKINNDYIYIIGENDKEVIIRGGNTAIQFSEISNVFIKNIIFEQQKYNAVNIDDGGTFDTPASRFIITNCTFRDMDASDNNDLLKLSGLDTFVVENCIFENGSAGGSGIDMVGCHKGRIESNVFRNMGSNAIQAKGGTQYILIYRNFFENCGQRSLNLGGSTSLAYFRPLDAKFEAADLAVWSNIFIGSISPINFVGSIRVDVTNNTIIKPENWVIRILQETVDESRFYKCGQGKFENNIVYLPQLKTETNIGPNTAPDEFVFANNFWYNYENPNWQGPFLPTIDKTQIINIDPMFEDIVHNNFSLASTSPAIAKVAGYINPPLDFFGNKFSTKRSLGAIEVVATDNKEQYSKSNVSLEVYPNPATSLININVNPEKIGLHISEIYIYDITGKVVKIIPFTQNIEKLMIDISNLKTSVYSVVVGDASIRFLKL
ncbi:MAG TPA: T9SS type A sorting domain-containing protein [Candidatus Kapabacteria bacterium]|nr:T9SS type A sorting domain-containing protein [Candidatus Kapabacteria bacterium]